MAVRRISLRVLGVAAVTLFAAHVALAKEGVKATLNTAIPLDAPAGTHVKVGFNLAYLDEQGRRRPFGANAVFVRLLSKTGAGAKTGVVPSGPYADGKYSTTVVVPDGGIRDIQIGLRGFTSGATGTRNADVLFRITNDPLPGIARVIVPASGTNWRPWLLVVGFAGLLLVLTSLAFAVVRRRTPGVAARG
jgi:hypothetical protein